MKPKRAAATWRARRGSRSSKIAEESYVEISLDGTEDHIRALIKEDEWLIIKTRIDAALAGEDPNQSKFYMPFLHKVTLT